MSLQQTSTQNNKNIINLLLTNFDLEWIIFQRPTNKDIYSIYNIY
jgi:hypothetical protein